MFGLGMFEILLILAVALLVIGPKKLPDLAKSLGRAMGEFKKATNDLKDSINLDDPIDVPHKPVETVKNLPEDSEADPYETDINQSPDETDEPIDPDNDSPQVKD